MPSEPKNAPDLSPELPLHRPHAQRMQAHWEKCERERAEAESASPVSVPEERQERALTAAVHWARARAALDRAEGMEDAARCLELLVTALDDTRSHVARLTRERDEAAASPVVVPKEREPLSFDAMRAEVLYELRARPCVAIGCTTCPTHRAGAVFDRFAATLARQQSALDVLAVAVKEAEKFTTLSSYRDTAYVSLPQWRDLMQAITALLDGRTTT